MKLLAVAFIGLLPLLVMSANLGHTSTASNVRAQHAPRGHRWNVRWHGPTQHLRVLRAIERHDKWVISHAAKFRFAPKLVSFHGRELAHAQTKIRQAKAKLRPVYSIPHYNEWQCIHSHEGAWDDPDPPYFGGLQMDWDFMRTWGPELLAAKGTADHWTPLEQMMVAERAWVHRGFTPWPNTARMCELL